MLIDTVVAETVSEVILVLRVIPVLRATQVLEVTQVRGLVNHTGQTHTLLPTCKQVCIFQKQ